MAVIFNRCRCTRPMEMKRNKNEYFGQITVAFLSSRIKETDSLLYSTAEESHCDLAEIFILVSFHFYMS